MKFIIDVEDVYVDIEPLNREDGGSIFLRNFWYHTMA